MKKIKLYCLIIATILASMVAGSCKDDENEEELFITVNPEELVFANSGEELSQSVEVKSNGKWTAAFVEDSVSNWASTDVKSGEGNGVIRITVLENAGTERSATLKLTSGSVTTNVQITQNAKEGESTNQFISVAQLRNKGEGYISDTVYVKASVISNKEGGNSTSLKNVVLSDGEAGIFVTFSADADYAIGTELELYLFGAQLIKQNGLLLLNNFNNSNAKATGQTSIIPAKTISIADLLNSEYESMYVAIADVEVIPTDLGKTMVIDGKATRIGMEAKTGDNFYMFQAPSSVFKDSKVPRGAGTLKGIAGINIGDGGIAMYQIAPQTAEDFAGLTGNRFNGVTFGTPKYVGPGFEVDKHFDANMVIPYHNATGQESYFVSIYPTGEAWFGIDTAMQSKRLVVGDGELEIALSGTPKVAGDFFYTITGIAELTDTIVNCTVAEKPVVNKADFNTLLTATSTFGDVTTTAGWVAKNSAILKGGSKNTMPTFMFIGEDEARAVYLNGNTTAIGTLTSPILKGGCDTLSFDYGYTYPTDKSGISLKIEIKQNNTTVKTLDLIKTTNEVVVSNKYSYAAEVKIAGDYQIVITNNCPSGKSSNSDRVAIFNLTCPGYKSK